MNISQHLKQIHKAHYATLLMLGIFGCFSISLAAEPKIKQVHSQPVQKKNTYPKVSCSNWEKGSGTEGNCVVETKETSWEASYYIEGSPKLDFRGKLKNGMIIFHPDGYSHRFYEWWGDIVGKGKAIDTNKWMVISLSTPGDGKPKLGSPILLTYDQIFTVQKAVIDQVMPKGFFSIAGASRGGHLAMLWAQKHDNIEKAILINTHGIGVYKEKEIIDYLNGLKMKELELGPYEYWSEKDRVQWWKVPSQMYVDLSYSEPYFKDPQMLKDHEKTPEDYKDVASFKELVLNSWTGFFANFVAPRWYIAQVNALEDAISSVDDQLYKRLPKRILYIANDPDLLVTEKDVSAFVSNAKKSGRKVTYVKTQDDRGHLSCCSNDAPDKSKEAIKDFLD